VEVVTQSDAMGAVTGAHLSGHGGTNDGIIGAAAGVGLTAWGWSGRFVEYQQRLRDFPAQVDVAALEEAGMTVLPVDRNVVSPRNSDIVDTDGWLRPRLWGGRPSVPVTLVAPNRWFAFGKRPVHVGEAKPRH